MLKILHSPAQQASLPMKASVFENRDVQNPADLKAILSDSYIRSLQSGRLITMGYEGVELADSVANGGLEPMGFIIVDAYYAGYYNRPGVASYLLSYVPIESGVVVMTDQISSGEIWENGSLVYCGTGQNKGLVTLQATEGTKASVDLFTPTTNEPGQIKATAKYNGTYGNRYSIVVTPQSGVGHSIERDGNVFTLVVHTGTASNAIVTTWNNAGYDDFIELSRPTTGAVTAGATSTVKKLAGGTATSKEVGVVQVKPAPTSHMSDEYWIHCR